MGCLTNYVYVKLCCLVDELVSFVTAHFADSVFEHGVLLEEVVDGYFVLCVVVHGALEERSSGSAECRSGRRGQRGR